MTSVCPSIHPSVCPQGGGGYPYPIMLCNISQNAMRQWRGGTRTPPGGTRSGTPPGGYLGQVPPRGGVPGSGTPPGGVPGSGNPPGGGYPGQVPPPGGGGTRLRYPPPGGVPRSGTPPGGYPGQVTPPGGGTRVGQQKEYSLHGGRYASCVHAGGLSCNKFIWNFLPENLLVQK